MYVKICTLLTFYYREFVHLYFHPWDFYPFSSDSQKWGVNPLFIRNTDKFAKQFEEYLGWLKQKGVLFMTVRDYLKKTQSD